ncbi:unnamed protein product [Paramecium primaurelia]|uniref:Transmembrane protein n=1 Tax=Paramecium primaurelia TaxID=5886 RepID=A0A8S1LMV4_PARPR|nr:unnamed protein product [Paramecium primaurelia]
MEVDTSQKHNQSFQDKQLYMCNSLIFLKVFLVSLFKLYILIGLQESRIDLLKKLDLQQHSQFYILITFQDSKFKLQHQNHKLFIQYNFTGFQFLILDYEQSFTIHGMLKTQKQVLEKEQYHSRLNITQRMLLKELLEQNKFILIQSLSLQQIFSNFQHFFDLITTQTITDLAKNILVIINQIFKFQCSSWYHLNIMGIFQVIIKKCTKSSPFFKRFRFNQTYNVNQSTIRFRKLQSNSYCHIKRL